MRLKKGCGRNKSGIGEERPATNGRKPETGTEGIRGHGSFETDAGGKSGCRQLNRRYILDETFH